VNHLSSDSQSGSAERQDSDDKSDIYAAEGGGKLQHGKNETFQT
jgi:hypothetical protein